jgi:hypothetical protein
MTGVVWCNLPKSFVYHIKLLSETRKRRKNFFSLFVPLMKFLGGIGTYYDREQLRADNRQLVVVVLTSRMMRQEYF